MYNIDVVLVQILRYNCSETDYSFCEDSPPSRTPPSTRMRFSPSDPFSPHYFFRSTAPVTCCVVLLKDEHVVYYNHKNKTCFSLSLFWKRSLLNSKYGIKILSANLTH